MYLTNYLLRKKSIFQVEDNEKNGRLVINFLIVQS